MHTDASLGGLGVAWLPSGGEPCVFAARTPGYFCANLADGVNPIYILELAAAHAGAELLGTLASGGTKI